MKPLFYEFLLTQGENGESESEESEGGSSGGGESDECDDCDLVLKKAQTDACKNTADQTTCEGLSVW